MPHALFASLLLEWATAVDRLQAKNASSFIAIELRMLFEELG